MLKFENLTRTLYLFLDDFDERYLQLKNIVLDYLGFTPPNTAKQYAASAVFPATVKSEQKYKIFF